MPKHLLRRYLPDIKKLKESKALGVLGDLIHNPNLWHLNRYSVSWGFAIGLFCAFLPIPFQMVVAAFFAIIIKANLPLSVALVWLTNPITMPPVFYFAYKVGAFILRIPPSTMEFELSFAWITTKLQTIWEPLLVGSLVCGIVSAIIAFITIRIIWRIATMRAWNLRKLRRRLRMGK